MESVQRTTARPPSMQRWPRRLPESCAIGASPGSRSRHRLPSASFSIRKAISATGKPTVARQQTDSDRS
jgi:hypothetical protein